MEPESLPEQTVRLMQALDFTADDLWANQQGRFSQRQQARVLTIASQRRRTFLWTNIFGLGLLSLITLAVTPAILNKVYRVDAMPWQALIAIIVIVAIMAVSGRRTYLATIQPRLAPPALMMVQGQVKRITAVHRNVKTLTIVIDDQVFPANPALYAAFQDGEVYEIYYFTPFLGAVMLSARLLTRDS